MKLYRLTKKIYASSPFDPIGAKTYGGRWNSKGTEALYFSESESLCCLEVFVHVHNDPGLAKLYDLYQIDLPDSMILTLKLADLPPTWQRIPCDRRTQLIGDEFIATSAAAALQIPSVISPRDNNYLINPNYPGIQPILDNARRLDFQFDIRLFK